MVLGKQLAISLLILYSEFWNKEWVAIMLKSQDIYVLLKLVVLGGRLWSYAGLAVELGMSPSQVHASIKRALLARLAVRDGEDVRPQFRNLEEFIVHGLKYVFWFEEGGMGRGLPTSHAAAPLKDVIVSLSSELPPVWPDPEGEVRGIACKPLYKKAPMAARQDHSFYELLALVDGLRMGRARERQIAGQELKKRMEHYAQAY